MRDRAHQGRKKRLERVFEQWWLDIEPQVTSHLDLSELALQVAHVRTGHHSMCGLEGLYECDACTAEWEDAKARGRRALLAELGHLDDLDSQDVEALIWANAYQTYMSHEGSRMELIGWPQMYSDIALVGDGVLARARDQMMRKAREGAKG